MINDIAVKIGAIVAMVVVLFFAERYIEKRGYQRARAEDMALINEQKLEAAEKLASETDKVRDAEQALKDFKKDQELKDDAHQKTVANLSTRLSALGDSAGRLRDPKAIGCGAGSSGTSGSVATAPNDGATDTAETDGLLSTDLSRLLRHLVAEADTINVAYASCRADAYAVRK